MATMIEFSETQKAALVSLLIEMINADGLVDPRECDMFNTICVEYGINDETFSLGQRLDSMLAVDMMKRMSDMQKLAIAQLLTRVIDADTNDDDKEIQLFNVICKATGVDVLINALVQEKE
jgi:uncharacterized tellurite resistance protein B-like protein